MRETFELAYKGKLLGTIWVDHKDFPSTLGEIQFDRGALKKDKELQEYIAFSIQSSVKTVGDPSVYEEFINNEESNHRSVINNPEWNVISKDGVKMRISVPVFFGERGVIFTFR